MLGGGGEGLLSPRVETDHFKEPQFLILKDRVCREEGGHVIDNNTIVLTSKITLISSSKSLDILVLPLFLDLLTGYGKMAPATIWGRIFCIFYAIFGIPITGLMLKSIGERITETTANFWKLVDTKIFKREPRKIYLKTVACIFLMVAGMILLLAGIGKSYEGWTFFEGVYFAFITLSTIGFGDYVPQHPSKSEKEHPGYVIAFTVLTFIYFTFGLAVVSSALLAISRLFEDEPPWGFISLMGGDDAEDDEEENLLREKKKAQEKAKMAESSGP